jgi:hypothetical protein
MWPICGPPRFRLGTPHLSHALYLGRNHGAGDGNRTLCVPRISSTALTSRVALSHPGVMITGHVPAVRVPPDHTASRVATARPA